MDMLTNFYDFCECFACCQPFPVIAVHAIYVVKINGEVAFNCFFFSVRGVGVRYKDYHQTNSKKSAGLNLMKADSFQWNAGMRSF